MRLRDAPAVSSLVLVAVTVLGACSDPRLPEPIREPPCVAAPCRAAHEGEVPVLVPFPPPPARVDVISVPPAEMSDPVWVDGQWEWRGRAWVWEPGKWWQRPAAQYWAAPAIVRRADGQLVWFAGSFRPFGSPVPVAPAPSSAPPAPSARSAPSALSAPAPGGAGPSGGLSSPQRPGDKAGQAP